MNHLLSTQEAAQILGLKPQTLRRWRIRGEGIPFVRLARNRAAYDPEKIRSWAETRTFQSTAEESTRAAKRGK